MFNTNQFQMFVSVRLNRRIIFVHLVNQILYVDGITMSKTWNVTNFCMTPNVVAAVEMFFSQNTDVKWHVWLSAIKLRGKYIKKEMAQKKLKLRVWKNKYFPFVNKDNSEKCFCLFKCCVNIMQTFHFPYVLFAS